MANALFPFVVWHEHVDITQIESTITNDVTPRIKQARCHKGMTGCDVGKRANECCHDGKNMKYYVSRMEYEW